MKRNQGLDFLGRGLEEEEEEEEEEKTSDFHYDEMGGLEKVERGVA